MPMVVTPLVVSMHINNASDGLQMTASRLNRAYTLPCQTNGIEALFWFRHLPKNVVLPNRPKLNRFSRFYFFSKLEVKKIDTKIILTKDKDIYYE